jgi:hypothetical protein
LFDGFCTSVDPPPLGNDSINISSSGSFIFNPIPFARADKLC